MPPYAPPVTSPPTPPPTLKVKVLKDIRYLLDTLRNLLCYFLGFCIYSTKALYSSSKNGQSLHLRWVWYQEKFSDPTFWNFFEHVCYPHLLRDNGIDGVAGSRLGRRRNSCILSYLPSVWYGTPAQLDFQPFISQGLDICSAKPSSHTILLFGASQRLLGLAEGAR